MLEKNKNINYQNLDWNSIIESLKRFSTSDIARNHLNALTDLKSPEEALQSFYEITSAAVMINMGIRPFMESLDLFEVWSSRLRKNAVMKPLELKDIRHFCTEAISLKQTLLEQNTPWSLIEYDLVMDAEKPLSAIDSLITASCDIRMDASEKLYRLSREKENIARQIQTKLDRIVKDFDIEHMLQEKFVTNREGRWVIPVKGGLKHYVPGVVHGTSQTKQTVYIEPEVTIPMNNRLREIDIEIEEEIERLLVEISNYLYTLKDDFEKTKVQLQKMDILLSKAQLHVQLESEPCEFSETTLELKDLFHPMLKLSGKNPIPNNVTLDQNKRILILSGPNAGGKTVLLKSVGLAAQMARCGLPICANHTSKIPFFKNVLICIGDSQNVDEDLSTFAAHLKNLNTALAYKGSENLVLVDEICGSTDPEEGSALARAFITKYAENKVFGIITSHLSPLKKGWAPEGPIQNGSLEFDTKIGRPTYNFLPGIPGNSLALMTAKRVGINEDVLTTANSFLSPELQKKLSELEEIENLKKDIVNLQNHYKKEIKEYQKKQDLLDQEKKAFELVKEKEMAKLIKQASQTVEAAISETKAKETFDKHRKLQEIKYNLPEIVKASTANQPGKIDTAKDFGEKYPPGSKVFVNSLNQDGIVQSNPNAKGEILVLSQSMRLQVHWTDLKPALKFNNPTGQQLRKTTFSSATQLDQDYVLDLRGKTVDEAVSLLEVALDNATTKQTDRMKIIHGHGTDALKKAVRTYLSRSVYVKKWKSGNSESGGDGVTWVELGSL